MKRTPEEENIKLRKLVIIHREAHQKAVDFIVTKGCYTEYLQSLEEE